MQDLYQNSYLQLTTDQVKRQLQATASRVIMLLHINLFTKFWKIVSSFSVLTHQFSMLYYHNFTVYVISIQKLMSVLKIHIPFRISFSRLSLLLRHHPIYFFLLQPVFVRA